MKKRTDLSALATASRLRDYHAQMRLGQIDLSQISADQMAASSSFFDCLLPSDLLEDEQDVQYLGEQAKSKEAKGKEVLVISDDEEDKSKSSNPNWAKHQPFRFLDLPAELRVYIYQFLLPHNLSINFTYHHPYYTWRCSEPVRRRSPPMWVVRGRPKTGDRDREIFDIVPAKGSRPRGYQFVERTIYPRSETQLFLINKETSKEARAVLYASNTFNFTISGVSQQPLSLRSPQIFGPFGNNDRLSVLRDLRCIHLEVLINNHDRWTVIRQRSRLEYFVEVLKEYADDENRKSLLEELKVEVRGGSSFARESSVIRLPAHPLHFEKYMFGLESLASLRGIKKVDVQGVPNWYAKCLEVCIQGKGGDVEEVDWPLVEVKRRKNTGYKSRVQKKWVTSRQWYQPMLNWKEFAQRNQIEVPEDIDKYWMDEH